MEKSKEFGKIFFFFSLNKMTETKLCARFFFLGATNSVSPNSFSFPSSSSAFFLTLPLKRMGKRPSNSFRTNQRKRSDGVQDSRREHQSGTRKEQEASKKIDNPPPFYLLSFSLLPCPSLPEKDSIGRTKFFLVEHAGEERDEKV